MSQMEYNNQTTWIRFHTTTMTPTTNRATHTHISWSLAVYAISRTCSTQHQVAGGLVVGGPDNRHNKVRIVCNAQKRTTAPRQRERTRRTRRFVQVAPKHKRDSIQQQQQMHTYSTTRKQYTQTHSQHSLRTPVPSDRKHAVLYLATQYGQTPPTPSAQCDIRTMCGAKCLDCNCDLSRAFHWIGPLITATSEWISTRWIIAHSCVIHNIHIENTSSSSACLSCKSDRRIFVGLSCGSGDGTWEYWFSIRRTNQPIICLLC